MVSVQPNPIPLLWVARSHWKGTRPVEIFFYQSAFADASILTNLIAYICRENNNYFIYIQKEALVRKREKISTSRRGEPIFLFQMDNPKKRLLNRKYRNKRG